MRNGYTRADVVGLMRGALGGIPALLKQWSLHCVTNEAAAGQWGRQHQSASSECLSLMESTNLGHRFSDNYPNGNIPIPESVSVRSHAVAPIRRWHEYVQQRWPREGLKLSSLVGAAVKSL